VVNGFGHVCLLVRNLEQSLAFYRDLLGLVVVRRRTVEGEYPETAFGLKGVRIAYAKLRCPGSRTAGSAFLELQEWRKPKRRPAAGSHHISLLVADLGREYRRLRRRGVRFIAEPVTSPDRTTALCFGYDPDGNLIEFVERKQRRRTV